MFKMPHSGLRAKMRADIGHLSRFRPDVCFCPKIAVFAML